MLNLKRGEVQVNLLVATALFYYARRSSNWEDRLQEGAALFQASAATPPDLRLFLAALKGSAAPIGTRSKRQIDEGGSRDGIRNKEHTDMGDSEEAIHPHAGSRHFRILLEMGLHPGVPPNCPQ